MFFHSNTILVIFILGIIATFIGFGLRDRNLGLVLLGLGLLATLFAIINRVAWLFGG